MNNASLAAVGAAVLALSGFAHAGMGPAVPVALPAAAAASAAVHNVSVLGAPKAGSRARNPDIVAVSDLAPAPVRSTWSEAPEKRKPIYSSRLSAEQDAADGKTTEAPLPGALWLFGSALLAFLGICARRRF